MAGEGNSSVPKADSALLELPFWWKRLENRYLVLRLVMSEAGWVGGGGVCSRKWSLITDSNLEEGRAGAPGRLVRVQGRGAGPEWGVCLAVLEARAA